jgi:hypothetical protein
MGDLKRVPVRKVKATDEGHGRFHLIVTSLTREARRLLSGWATVKSHLLKPPERTTRRARKPPRQTVAAILRAAYELHVRDPLTRRAVKRVLH